MSEMEQNRVRMHDVKKWFGITETFELLFAVIQGYSTSDIPVVSIISVILLIALTTKNKMVVLVGTIWHTVIFAGSVFFSAWQKPAPLGDIDILNSGSMIFVRTIFIAIVTGPIVYVYIKAFFCAVDHEKLKYQEGYPYFDTLILATTTKKMIRNKEDEPKQKIKTFIIDWFHVVMDKEVIDDIGDISKIIFHSLFKKPQDIVDWAKYSSMFIILLGFFNLHYASPLYSAFNFVFLFFALVFQKTGMASASLKVHIVLDVMMLIGGPISTNMFLYIALVIIYAGQTILYYAAYKQLAYQDLCIKQELEENERMRSLQQKEEAERLAQSTERKYEAEKFMYEDQMNDIAPPSHFDLSDNTPIINQKEFCGYVNVPKKVNLEKNISVFDNTCHRKMGKLIENVAIPDTDDLLDKKDSHNNMMEGVSL